MDDEVRQGIRTDLDAIFSRDGTFSALHQKCPWRSGTGVVAGSPEISVEAHRQRAVARTERSGRTGARIGAVCPGGSFHVAAGDARAAGSPHPASVLFA